MKIVIKDKVKKDIFTALFQTLKNCTNIICVIFYDDHLYIQGMDNSHICLFNVKILNSWFNEYQKNNNELEKICFDTHVFCTIIGTKQDSHSINITFNNESDNLNVSLIAQENNVKGEFNKFFKMPLVDFDYDLMDIPIVDYDAEKLSTNQIIWGELMWGEIAKSSTQKSVLLWDVKKAPTYC